MSKEHFSYFWATTLIFVRVPSSYVRSWLVSALSAILIPQLMGSERLSLWGCRVYWQHLCHAAHCLSVTRQNLCTNDNSLQIRQWPPGRVPLINGGGERQVYSNSDGVPTVPSRRYSIQCITDWIGEQDNPRTTVTCSPQSRIPSQHLETSQATPFHSLYFSTNHPTQRSSPEGSLVHGLDAEHYNYSPL